MKTSCINHPANEPLIMIRQWQVDACDGNHCAAALLSFFEYWHNIRRETSEKAGHVARQAEKHGEELPYLPAFGTWLQWHNEDELSAGLLDLYGRTKIAESLKLLERKGFLEIHKNPNPRYVFDKTRHFLFREDKINDWLKTYNPRTINRRRQTKKGRQQAENSAPIPETTPEITPENTHKTRARAQGEFLETEEKDEQPGDYGGERVDAQCMHIFPRLGERCELLSGHSDAHKWRGYYWDANNVDGIGVMPDSMDTLQPVATPSAGASGVAVPAEACRAYQKPFACDHMREAIDTIVTTWWPTWRDDNGIAPYRAYLDEFSEIDGKPRLHAAAHRYTLEQIAQAAQQWQADKQRLFPPLFVSQLASTLATAQSQENGSARRLTPEEERAREKTKAMVARIEAENEAEERKKQEKRRGIR